MRAKHLGQTVTIEGNVIKTSTQYPFCSKAAFQCLRCGHINMVAQDHIKSQEPFGGCENDTCGKKGPFKFIPEESTFIDAKEIEICDLSDDVLDKYEGYQHVRLKVILIDDAVKQILTDQKFKFTGRFTTSELGRKLEYLLYADIVENVPEVESKPTPYVESQPVNIISETSKSQRDKIKLLRKCIEDVHKRHTGREGAPLEEIYELAESKYGIDRPNAVEYIKRMKQGGDLLSPDQNHIRLVP